MKTSITDKTKFLQAYEQTLKLPRHQRALFAWEGLSLESAQAAILESICQDPIRLAKETVDIIIVRGQYLLWAVHDGELDSPCYRFIRIDEASRPEGDGLALVILANWLYRAGRQDVPWWLDITPGRMDGFFPWPDKVKAKLSAEAARRRANR